MARPTTSWLEILVDRICNRANFDMGGCYDLAVSPGSLIRRDDVMEVDVRLTLETDDKHQIYVAWKGLRHGPKEVMDRVYRGEIVDPGAYYFRTTPYFETSSEKYGWMNRICSIASGSLSAKARTLDVFQVL